MINLFHFCNNWLEKLILLEQNCVLCGCTNEEQICQDCYQSLTQKDSSLRCQRCLIKLPPKEISCANCKENNFNFERIISAFEYGFPLDKILHQLKYNGKIDYTTLLSQLFWSQITRQIKYLPDVIIPVPLHPRKHKLRGFNQVHELLREFKQLHPSVKLLQIQRNKETLQQASLNRQQRLSNLNNAFTINADLSGKKIVIVDDVVTSGSTVNEIAKLCKQLGAVQVETWCLMRAQH